MAPTAPPVTQPHAAGRFGGRPARTARPGCKGCGHPYALHGNGSTICQAFACTGGPGQQPCRHYTDPAAPERLAS